MGMTREQAINYLISSGFSEEQVSEVVRALTYEPTTKNDLGVDCISRKSVITIIQNHWWNCRDIDKLVNELPSVTPQEPILDKIRADYENRLKADMVAMLEEIQLEADENLKKPYCLIIQQKINSLKEDV